jgi:glycosyltransferase involved in cell wall biosynthesis
LIWQTYPVHFLLISSILGPTIGGTEALIGRMSKWLLTQGHQVTLLANNTSSCREVFPTGLRIIELGDQLFEFCYWRKSATLWRQLEIGHPDVIKSYDLTASWIATVLAARMNPPPKVLFGNYMPYIVPTSRNPFKQHTRKLLLRNLMASHTDESILCMTQEHIAEFQGRFGSHRKINFWPLPVVDPSRNSPPRAPQWGHIVSIGRLDTMKEYNLYMIDIIARLRAKGLPVTWSVYGDGELRDAMVTRINQAGLAGVIQLKGRIPNTEVAGALREAYAFVGMGTAIIEAALCGVPGIVALAYELTDATYGPLYRFTFGNVGERMSTEPTTTVEQELERILGLAPAAYAAEVQKTVNYAKGYEMAATMNRFLAFVEAASPTKPSLTSFYLYYVDAFVNRLLRSPPPGASSQYYSKARK